MYRLLLITSFVVFAASNLFGQKCKYDYDRKDVITGHRVRGVNVRQFGNYLSIGSVADSFFISIMLTVANERKEIIQKGDSMILKLENEKSLCLYSRHQCNPVVKTGSIAEGTNAVRPEVSTIYSVVYPVSEQDLMALKESPIRACRVFWTGLSSTLIFGEKDMLKVQKAAVCLDSDR